MAELEMEPNEVMTPEDLVSCLNIALADVYNMEVMAHGAHWNVEGIEFHQYHDLFGKIYEDVAESVDPIAENIRKLGYPAPATLDDFVEYRSVKPQEMTTDPKQMAAALNAQNDAVLKSMKDVYEDADKLNEQGIANFASERIDMHQKWSWQLRSSGSNAGPASKFLGGAKPVDKTATLRRSILAEKAEEM